MFGLLLLCSHATDSPVCLRELLFGLCRPESPASWFRIAPLPPTPFHLVARHVLLAFMTGLVLDFGFAVLPFLLVLRRAFLVLLCLVVPVVVPLSPLVSTHLYPCCCSVLHLSALKQCPPVLLERSCLADTP